MKRMSLGSDPTEKSTVSDPHAAALSRLASETPLNTACPSITKAYTPLCNEESR